LEELINEESNQMTSTDNQKEIILDQFYEFFARFCVVWIETPKLVACLKFLELLFERTTKIVYRNINNKGFSIFLYLIYLIYLICFFRNEILRGWFSYGSNVFRESYLKFFGSKKWVLEI